jgi:hypothetical protein
MNDIPFHQTAMGQHFYVEAPCADASRYGTLTAM